MSELPPGFVLDAPAEGPAQAQSGLPAGFVLDGPAMGAPAGSAPFAGKPPVVDIAELENSHGGSFISGLINSIGRAASLPGEVYAGKVDPRSDEGIGRAFEMATTFNPAPQRMTTRNEGSSIFTKDPRASAQRAAEGPLPAVEMPADAAARLGVEMPRFVASDSRAVQALGQAARQLPLAGGIVEKAADKFSKGLSEAAQKTATELGGVGMDRAALGNELRGSVERAVGKLDEVNDSAFSTLRGLINGKKPISESMEPIRGALAGVMESRIGAGEDGLAAQLAPIANLLQRPGGASFDGLQRARSQLSRAIKWDEREGGMAAGDLKQVYGALSEAMERAAAGAAKGAPEEAVAALRAANARFSENSEVMHSLGKALKSPSDEALVGQVLGMAGEKTGNAKRLFTLNQQLGPDTMRQLGGHIIDQAGAVKDGGWSAARFTTAMEKLSEGGKDLLFGPMRKQVDDLTAVANRWASQEAKFANKSQTGRAGLTGAALTAMVHEPLTGILTAAGSVAAGITLGKVLSRPATARAAADMAKAQEFAARTGSEAADRAYQGMRQRFVETVAREFPVAANSQAQPTLGADAVAGGR